MVDHTKVHTEEAEAERLGAAMISSQNETCELAANICEAKAEDEKDRVDNECECDGTGDYSAYHSLKAVAKQIRALSHTHYLKTVN